MFCYKLCKHYGIESKEVSAASRMHAWHVGWWRSRTRDDVDTQKTDGEGVEGGEGRGAPRRRCQWPWRCASPKGVSFRRERHSPADADADVAAHVRLVNALDDCTRWLCFFTVSRSSSFNFFLPCKSRFRRTGWKFIFVANGIGKIMTHFVWHVERFSRKIVRKFDSFAFIITLNWL